MSTDHNWIKWCAKYILISFLNKLAAGSLRILGLNSTADASRALLRRDVHRSAVFLGTHRAVAVVIKMEILFAWTFCRRAANLISPAICRAVSRPARALLRRADAHTRRRGGKVVHLRRA